MKTPDEPVQSAPSTHAKASETRPVVVERAQAVTLLCDVLERRDRDCDRRVTVLDLPRQCETEDCRGFAPHQVVVGDRRVDIASVGASSQLVSEIVAGLDAPGAQVSIDAGRAALDPVSYLEAQIRQRYWDGLTRRIDPSGQALRRALVDAKVGGGPLEERDYCAGKVPHCSGEDAAAVAGDQAQAPSGVADEAASVPPERVHLYVPVSDPVAQRVYRQADQSRDVEVLVLPKHPGAAWVEKTTREGRHGLLSLALDDAGRAQPFVVPGGRFNEMYGWDSFFIVLGLVEDAARLPLARAMVEHHAYEIRHYGKILNANRTYYLTRSQPPFFTSTLRAVVDAGGAPNEVWVGDALDAAIAEYREVWSKLPRLTPLCDGDLCLARYHGEGTGEPPEVESEHFAWIYQQRAIETGRCPRPSRSPQSQRVLLECARKLASDYRAGRAADPVLDRFFIEDRCVRESGHDTTFRWFGFERGKSPERCTQFATVDLNALLFKYELDIAELLSKRSGLAAAQPWCARAQARARLMRKYLADDAGMFSDYDFGLGNRSRYLSATSLYPLWASPPNAERSVCKTTLLSPEQARNLVQSALAELEAPGGVLATAPSSVRRVVPPWVVVASGSTVKVVQLSRQWEAPNGWAPHQMIAWQGLLRWGFDDDAHRLAYRWLYMVALNATDYHGTVPEKFDVVQRTHRVFAEYGNVNTDFAYIAREGFGWVNASFLVGLRLLPSNLREKLNELLPPEEVFGRMGDNAEFWNAKEVKPARGLRRLGALKTASRLPGTSGRSD